MVKTILKKNNITLLQFANDLNISRPTLDVYIKNYDNQIELTNSVFQKIFDFLFEDDTLSIEEFTNKYEYVKSYYGKKDADLSVLHSKSVSSSDVDEYNEICDRIMDILVKSKDLNRIKIEKLKSIERVLLEDKPEIEFLWAGKHSAILKPKNLGVYQWCIKMEKSQPDCFPPEIVIFDGNYKYICGKEDTDLEVLKNWAEAYEKMF